MKTQFPETNEISQAASNHLSFRLDVNTIITTLSAGVIIWLGTTLVQLRDALVLNTERLTTNSQRLEKISADVDILKEKAARLQQDERQ
jgi:hypothetical protein